MRSPSSNRVRVLAVDDERAVLESYEKILGRAESPQVSDTKLNELQARLFGATPHPSLSTPEFDLTVVSQGNQAVEVIRDSLAHERPFRVVFLDVRMPPGPDGVTTAEHIRALDPDIEIVIVTADSDVDPAEIGRRVQPTDKLLYVQKPFHPHEVRHFAATLSAKWEAGRRLREPHEESQKRLDALVKANERLTLEMAERDQAERGLAARTQELGEALEDLERRAREAEALLTITRATESMVESNQLFKVIAQEAAKSCGVDRCTIFLWLEEHARIVPVMCQFADGEKAPTCGRRSRRKLTSRRTASRPRSSKPCCGASRC